MDLKVALKIQDEVQLRLKEFENLRKKSSKEWFSELCFCILTANSKALTAIAIQKELGAKGFIHNSEFEVSNSIRKNKHRFHNNKTKYILEARAHLNIKEEVISLVNEKTEKDARNWLATNIKGIGMKEASHFMRNVGYKNLAILDRHILRLLAEENYIPEVPKTISKKLYVEIEGIFLNIAKEFNMNAAELDLTMWYIKTGKVLK